MSMELKNDKENSYTPRVKQRMFSKPFSFDGRIRRLEYCLSWIISFVCFQVIYVMADLMDSLFFSLFLLVCWVMVFWFALAQGAKRCHDRGNSGLYQIIPFYGLWMMFGDGDSCENEYGFDPKGRDL